MNGDREATAAAIEGHGAAFDLIVIGGGANGAGAALDAASRGLRVALFERGGFGCGTSSRSSKLIHGGIRYLPLGQWSLVREALRERQTLLALASAVVKPLSFVVPAYSCFERLKFSAGLQLYDRLAGRERLTASTTVGAGRARALVPGLAGAALSGAVCYTDARFDDTRLLLALLARAREAGALTLNHAAVVGFARGAHGRLDGVVVADRLGGREFSVRGRAIVNAAGPYGDAVRQLDHTAARTRITLSQGAHLVVPRRFVGSDRAVVFPRTADGRIMFAVPWHGRTLLGTTDVAVSTAVASPRPLESEIEDILTVAGRFLDPAPTRVDLLSVFAGLRPLAGDVADGGTAERSREHQLVTDANGLISITGGKWTTYRVIAAQAVDVAVRQAALKAAPSRTHALPVCAERADAEPRFAHYGPDAPALAALVAARPALGTALHPQLPYCAADVVWAVRSEGARRLLDVLALHTRALFIDAAAAWSTAPRVVGLMADELGYDTAWQAQELSAAHAEAQAYSVTPIRAHDTPG